MEHKVGFIGCGNMARAIMGGLLYSELLKPADVIVSARTDQTLHYIQDTYSVRVTKDNKEVAQQANILFLAVKPDDYATIIEEVKEQINKEKTIIVTIAAGLTIEWVQNKFGASDLKVVRTMPNTPSLVRQGMTAFSCSESMNNDEQTLIEHVLNSFGKSERISETLMDSIPAVSGSSPAYVFMFIEALADGAVKQGVSRDKAYQLAAQAVKGAAEMVLETGKHPGVLKDQVCSPGGATIEAVATLEKNGFRGAVLEAMEQCYQKIIELGKQT